MRGYVVQAKHGCCRSAARRSTCANTCAPPQGLAEGALSPAAETRSVCTQGKGVGAGVITLEATLNK